MKLLSFDYLIISLFMICFVYLIRQAMQTRQSYPDFFTGSTKTHWIATAFSILSMNISFEYIFSSSSNGFNTGLPFACYEWTAIPVIIFVAYYILPHFLRLGVLTLPEYLEYRFNKTTRIIMAVYFLLATLASAILVLTSCSEFMEDLFEFNKHLTIVVLAVIGSLIIYLGGADTRIKANYLFFSFFLIAGSLLLIFSIVKVGGLDQLLYRSDGRLKSIMPADSKILPWKSVFLGGMWVLHFNYWGFFPPIAHPSLAKTSLSQTQKGLMLVASLKILISFIMIIPGIVGYELYRNEITNPEHTLPYVIAKVVPEGFEGIITMGYFATLFTTFSVIINTAMSLFTLDIYGAIKPSKPKDIVKIARWFIIIFVSISVIGASTFDHTLPFFQYATLILDLISPISVSVYLVAIYTKRTPPIAAILAIFISLPIWIGLKMGLGMNNFNVAGSLFLILTGMMLLFNWFRPLPAPVILKDKYEIKYERSLLIVIWSIFLITIVTAFYTILI
jgi:solute:Na+ symporter, SSS family